MMKLVHPAVRAGVLAAASTVILGLTATAYAQAATLAGMLLGVFCADRMYLRTKAARFWLLLAGLVLVGPSLYLVARADSFELAKAAAAAFGFGCGLFMANIFPAAFDVGPGSVRASAVGGLNPQAQYGGDLMSRIAYAQFD